MLDRPPWKVPPGAEPLPSPLREAIDAKLAGRPPGIVPRTRHRDGETPHYANRLVLEASPYLRQHAHNPVNWFPWGDEAFAQARRAGKPVFLSIGYSTCHWCHVMEEESFEDLEVARLVNERYVAIKVDREERPDIDTIYMTYVQALTGRGGWPMSVWLDGDRRPFYAGTYFPARDGDRGASGGFLTLAGRLADLYRDEPERIASAADSAAETIRGTLSRATPDEGLPETGVLDAATDFYARAYDATYGGLQGAPKFPSSLPIRALLRQHRRTGDAHALVMAEHTLAMMAAGGMHDQLGGGFHRYSTDERWLVPHFEKMLYDNALLALAYAEAWQVTKRREFARVARTTLAYVLREMTAPDGAFYSATDADSEGEEGTFFIWSEREIRQILGAEAERFMRYYGVTPSGNFEGANVLHVPHPDEEEWEALHEARELLRSARERRPPPLRDDKILTAWNGLTISAMAAGGRILGEPRFVAAAARAADFILAEVCVNGRLQRSWNAAGASAPGFLEDDAFFTAGLLDLYEATFEQRYLAAALTCAAQTETLFADAEHGGWFRTAGDHERLIAREKPNYDGAEPSGASVAIVNALRIANLTGEEGPRRVAARALRSYAAMLRAQPAALGTMLVALDYFTAVPLEIVLVWPSGGGVAAAYTEALRQMFLPHHAFLGAAEGADAAALAGLAPPVANKVAIDGRPTAYVCAAGTCGLPATSPAAMVAQLS